MPKRYSNSIYIWLSLTRMSGEHARVEVHVEPPVGLHQLLESQRRKLTKQIIKSKLFINIMYLIDQLVR